jgi:hypothetical protein
VAGAVILSALVNVFLSHPYPNPEQPVSKYTSSAYLMFSLGLFHARLLSQNPIPGEPPAVVSGQHRGSFLGLRPAESCLIQLYAVNVGFGELTACGEVVSLANVELIYSARQTSRQIFAYENFCK